MAQFSYKARSRSGEVMQGVLESVDRAGALSKLQRDGLYPVSIQPAKGKAAKSKKEKSARAAKVTKVKLIKEGGSGRFRF
ncbi:MAG: type II secretion system protein, partial [Verrucomicrobiota bacterium]|nr:type II secretion system protein [Verrucomicrobiota bacterium]